VLAENDSFAATAVKTMPARPSFFVELRSVNVTSEGASQAPGRSGQFADLLARTYASVVGTPLVSAGISGEEAANWLYEAPFGLLAHDTSPDPLFVYANLAAQQWFEYSWHEIVGMPSRLSAEGDDRETRRIFMDSVRRQGYADEYRGLRVAKTGRRFWIEETTVWNMISPGAGMVGQAALIRRSTDA
jgi:MEKHLA domain